MEDRDSIPTGGVFSELLAGASVDEILRRHGPQQGGGQPEDGRVRIILGSALSDGTGGHSLFGPTDLGQLSTIFDSIRASAMAVPFLDADEHVLIVCPNLDCNFIHVMVDGRPYGTVQITDAARRIVVNNLEPMFREYNSSKDNDCCVLFDAAYIHGIGQLDAALDGGERTRFDLAQLEPSDDTETLKDEIAGALRDFVHLHGKPAI